MAGFRQAKAEQAAIKMGIYGPAGAGKTFTALLLAEGLARQQEKRIAFVDTERGTDFYVQAVQQRRVHPDAFDVDALYSRSIAEVMQAVRSLDPKVYAVVVIDSITHIWEAAIAAYNGRKNRNGGLPFHAWGQIKKPYKELLQFLLNSPMHVILCGRQGTIYETDEDTDEVKAVGLKMKAEGETPYEPHILARIETERDRVGAQTIRVFFEKDRTGILSGRTITLYTPDGKTPATATYDQIARPLLGLLGGTQGQTDTMDEAAVKDAEAFDRAERERLQSSAALREKYEARFKLADTEEQIAAIAKELTPAVKKALHPEDLTTIRGAWQDATARVKGGGVRLVGDADPRDGEAP